MRTAIMRTKFTCKIELLFLLYSFSTALPHSGIFLMLRTKACLHHLQYDPDICSDINDHPEERNEVYRLASIFALLSEALLTLLSALIAILAGPWCDTYGYKGPLTITVVGACGTTICGFLVAFLGKDSSMWYNVLCVLPQGITGGIVLMRACCYAAITKEVDLLRALRFFALDMVGLLGRFGGVVLGWLLSHIIGHALCLLVAGFCQAGLLLFVTNNPDLMDPTLIDSGTCKRLAHLFSMTNIKAAFNIFGGNKKEDVISALKMLFMLLTLISIMNMGPEEIMQPYTRTVLGWSVITYTWISGVGNVVTALGGILAVVCCNMVCCSALHLIAIGVFSAMITCLQYRRVLDHQVLSRPSLGSHLRTKLANFWCS
ncbi:uncharacterized protein LOC135393236 isoform X2 [Ornithodoros turicata]|uniref:uncharacterized protein LOC135393236 isoform X2 n=1 Tax=Ornithodoros turicata TaxID=34597 RepID=UPI00313A0FCE